MATYNHETTKAERRKHRFEEGFGWAMVQYYHYRYPLEYIESCILKDRTDEHFDGGIRAALRALAERPPV